MRRALAQMKNEGNMKKNHAKSLKYIKQAAENKANLILFPEVQLTEFFPQHERRDVSEYQLSINSEEVKAFQEVSHEYKIITVPNIYLKQGGKSYDASLFINENGEIQAFQNSVSIAMCNRVGCEEEMDFSGESIVIDANGNVIAKADDKEQIFYVDIDLSESKRVRGERPYTNLRRKEFYK